MITLTPNNENWLFLLPSALCHFLPRRQAFCLLPPALSLFPSQIGKFGSEFVSTWRSIASR
jgi:hypothetical protein